MTLDQLNLSNGMCPRIRTGLLRFQGNLPAGKKQQAKISLLLPYEKDGHKLDFKVEISSMVIEEANPTKPADDYMSLRLSDLGECHSFLVSYLLVIRELAKQNGLAMWEKKKILEIIDAVYAGRYDERIHVYGMGEKNG